MSLHGHGERAGRARSLNTMNTMLIPALIGKLFETNYPLKSQDANIIPLKLKFRLELANKENKRIKKKNNKKCLKHSMRTTVIEVN